MPHKTELFVPAITPFAADMSVDHGRLVAHGRSLLSSGAHGLAPFGTTSEANSLSVAERMAALESLRDAGIPGTALIPGTGCCAVPDTIALSAHATRLGCRGVLMLPPFYYKGVSDDGIFAAYAQVIEAVGAAELGVYLYHFPQMSGIGISLPLIERLMKAYPGTIRGLKDSSGNWEYSREVITSFPEIAVYSGSESLLSANVATGGAGCISASANVNPGGIRRLIDGMGGADEAALLEKATNLRKIFEGIPLIPAIKAAVAMQRGDEEFARPRPPFLPLAPEHRAAVERAVALAEG